MNLAIKLIVLLLLCGGILHPHGASAQSGTYSVTFTRPQGIQDQQILGPFLANSDFSDVRLDSITLRVTVHSLADYPIERIRELLARSGAVAVDYTQAESFRQPAARSTTLKTDSFHVSGACGMCKDRIERAAKTVPWVMVVSWNDETQVLTLKYREVGEALMRVHEAIAQVGHDTDKVRAKDSVYESLHHCCRYERRPIK